MRDEDDNKKPRYSTFVLVLAVLCIGVGWWSKPEREEKSSVNEYYHPGTVPVTTTSTVLVCNSNSNNDSNGRCALHVREIDL